MRNRTSGSTAPSQDRIFPLKKPGNILPDPKLDNRSVVPANNDHVLLTGDHIAMPISTFQKRYDDYTESLRRRTITALKRRRYSKGMNPGPVSRQEIQEVAKALAYIDLFKLHENSGKGRLEAKPRM